MHAYKQTSGFELLRTNTQEKREVRSLLVTTSKQLISQPYTMNALRINITVGSGHSNAVPSIGS